MSNKLEQFLKSFEEKQEAFRNEAKGIFKEYCKEFLQENPEIKTVVFAAYTPYFNDGEECVFSVHGCIFTNASKSEADIYEIYQEDVPAEYETWYGDCGSSKKSYSEFSNMVESSIMNDVIRSMFGDHVLVAIDAEGFEVVDYEHE